MPGYALLSSTELVRKCVESDHPAVWKEFIRRFQPLISVVILRTARRWDEPSRPLLDDLVQETYLRLCADDRRLLRTFQPRHPDAIYGFVKKIAVNIVHDYYKSLLAGKRGTLQTDPISEEDPPEGKAGGGARLEAMERLILLKQIDEILLRAPGAEKERNRTIFWLHYRQGLTAREIGAIPSLGMGVKGVETVLKRTADMIRRHLTESGEGFERERSL